VVVEDRVVGEIGPGLLALVGVTHDDTAAEAAWLAGKLAGLRVFEDAEGRMNRSLVDAGGSVLVVSQFTLYGDARKGRRPSFIAAARPEVAAPLVEAVAEGLAATGIKVATGRFGAEMLVESAGDGPSPSCSTRRVADGRLTTIAADDPATSTRSWRSSTPTPPLRWSSSGPARSTSWWPTPPTASSTSLRSDVLEVDAVDRPDAVAVAAVEAQQPLEMTRQRLLVGEPALDQHAGGGDQLVEVGADPVGAHAQRPAPRAVAIRGGRRQLRTELRVAGPQSQSRGTAARARAVSAPARRKGWSTG
jgi:D-tyrosyl-tRNA(Tyr) deacylase